MHFLAVLCSVGGSCSASVVFPIFVAVHRLTLTCQCDLCAEVSEGLSCSTDAGLHITPFPLHPSTYLSVSFDTVLTPTWAAVTPIMHQPATWVPPCSHAHLTASSVVFLAISFYSETHAPPTTPIHSADSNQDDGNGLNLFTVLCWDWIDFQRNLPEVIEKQLEYKLSVGALWITAHMNAPLLWTSQLCKVPVI